MKHTAIKPFFDAMLKQSSAQHPLWNQEVLLGHIQPGWNYIDGCMMKAVLEMYHATKEPFYLEYLDSYVGYFIAEDGSITGYQKEAYNCDYINEGKVLFDLFDLTGKEKYRRAIELLYSQLVSQPRTPRGNFWHKQIYPNQVWLDGLYMVHPFYMAYERRYHQNENYRDIFLQLNTVYHWMRDAVTGLLYHGWDDTKQSPWANPKTGHSPHFWSRSLGWYTMALVDTLEQMDEMFFYEYQTLQTHLHETIDALLRVSDPHTGLFYQVTDAGPKEGNYLETSASCAIAYSILKAVRLGYLPDYYNQKGKRIFDSILQYKFVETEAGFSLQDICLVAGLGVYLGRGSYKERDGSFAYYISEPRVTNDAKGIAPFLFTYAEVYRREHNRK